MRLTPSIPDDFADGPGDDRAAENFRTLHKPPLNHSIQELEADRQGAERFRKP